MHLASYSRTSSGAGGLQAIGQDQGWPLKCIARHLCKSTALSCSFSQVKRYTWAHSPASESIIIL
jgi:hypothetical protein